MRFHPNIPVRSDAQCGVLYPAGSKPSIQWKHVDGPMLACRDGSIHFLTWKERLALHFKLITIDELDARHRSQSDCVVPRLDEGVSQRDYDRALSAAMNVADLFSPGVFNDAMVRDVAAVIANTYHQNSKD